MIGGLAMGENLDESVNLPLWFYETKRPNSPRRYISIEEAGQDVEYLNTEWSQSRDETNPTIVLDSLGRRVYMVIERAEVLVCRLESLEPRQEDLDWLVEAKAQIVARELSDSSATPLPDTAATVVKIVVGVLARIAGLALSGLLFMLALPPSGWHAVGWSCMVPALLAVRKTRFAVGFLGGLGLLMFAGFLTATGVFYSTKWFDGSTGWNYLGFAIFGVAVGGVLSIYSEKRVEGLRVAVYVAAAAVVAEAVLLVYLPGHLALTQFNNWTVVQLAGIGGIWLVSFLVWLSNVMIAEAIALKRYRAIGVVASVAGVLALAGSSAISEPLHRLLFPPVELAALRVGLVQTQSGEIETLGALNKKAASEGAQLAVWPELAAIGIALGGDTTDLVKLAKEPRHVPFVTSFVAPDPKGGMPFNMASFFTPSGESERYAKRKPFGAERNEHQAGTRPLIQTIDVPGWGQLHIGLTICFDTCFPSIMRELAMAGEVDLIVCPTLDPIGPHGSIQAIHAAYMPFRSSELGIPIARADTSAWSMMTDNTGGITYLGGTGTEEASVAAVQPFARPRLAKRLGDWWLVVCALLVGKWLYQSVRNRKSGLTSAEAISATE